MSLPTWIVLGIVAGFVASKLIGRSGQGLVLNLVLGIVGAVVGGALFSTSEMADGGGLNLYSFAVALAGAASALVAYHFLVRGAR